MPLDIVTVTKMMNEGKTLREVGAALGSSKSSVVRFSKKHGLDGWRAQGSPPKPLPADFIATAANMSGKQVQAHYHCSFDTAQRWFREAGIAPLVKRRPKTKTPDDLVERVQGLTIQAAAAELGVGQKVASRMMRQAGLVARRAPTPPPIRINKPQGSPLAPVNRYQRDMSVVGQAADFLRPLGAIWRCNETGAPSQGGKFWRRGSAVLTDADVIERATWKGFEPVETMRQTSP